MYKQYMLGQKSVTLFIDKRQESNIDIMVSFMNDMYWSGGYDSVKDINDRNVHNGIYASVTWNKIKNAFNI